MATVNPLNRSSSYEDGIENNKYNDYIEPSTAKEAEAYRQSKRRDEGNQTLALAWDIQSLLISSSSLLSYTNNFVQISS
jgi:hypothetical protein